MLSPAGKPIFPLFHCSINPVTLFLHQWPCSFEPYSNRFVIRLLTNLGKDTSASYCYIGNLLIQWGNQLSIKVLGGNYGGNEKFPIPFKKILTFMAVPYDNLSTGTWKVENVTLTHAYVNVIGGQSNTTTRFSWFAIGY